jgi:uroporphyrinogen-III synthase
MAAPTEAAGLSGLRVAIFESRHATEFANLVRKQGGEPLLGPSMVEAPLSLGAELLAFVDQLRAGALDAFLVLTGVGNRKLVELLAPVMPREELRQRLSELVVAARGPKAVGALRELGVRPQVVAPEPHTWQSLLAALEAALPLAGKRVGLQQYGVPHERLTRALVAQGAEVVQVPVYRWQLPEDLEPLSHVAREICERRVDVVLFTSGPQAGALFEVAARCGLEDALRAGFAQLALGSVGPSCSEALRNLELEPDFEPEHGKMGHLVLEAVRRARAVLADKRGESL